MLGLKTVKANTLTNCRGPCHVAKEIVLVKKSVDSGNPVRSFEGPDEAAPTFKAVTGKFNDLL